MEKDIITMGITAYNAPLTIKRAVISALNQEWQNTDIIIVDDASDDETPLIIASLVKKFPFIRSFRHPANFGVAVARNLIIAKAIGSFITFFDDDDESDPQRLSIQFERILQYRQRHASAKLILCHSSRIQIYPKNKRYYRAAGYEKTDEKAPNGKMFAQQLLNRNPRICKPFSVGVGLAMASRSMYRTLGGFDESFRRAEDMDFYVRAALSGAHFVSVPQPLVKQTMTLGTDKTLRTERSCLLHLLERHKDIISETIPYHFYHGWIDAKFDFMEEKILKFLLKILKLSVKYPIWTLRRVFSALPNVRYHLRFGRFYGEEK